MKDSSFNMLSNRQNNYDFLRFLSMISVIINHVTDTIILDKGAYKMVTYVWQE